MTDKLTDDELRSMWLQAGGKFHGPNVETGRMPESLLLPFLRSIAQPAEPAEAQPSSMPREALQAIMLAYGHLWHVNSEPAAPIPVRSPEDAAYAARKHLRDLLTVEQRREAINQVGVLIGRYATEAEPAEPAEAQPVAWITEEPDGNDFDGSYGGVFRGVVLGSERPDFGVTPLYTTPQPAQPLTDEQIQEAWDSVNMLHSQGEATRNAFARAIEAAHGIKP
jgi:hypothetical protein